MKIRIARGSCNTHSVTGELFVDGNFVCHTLELPWKEKQGYVSSIPEGNYQALLHHDQPDKWTLQIEGVPGRDNVLIHAGNYPSGTEGCVLVGRSVRNPLNTIHENVEAFGDLKNALYGPGDAVATPDTPLEVEVAFPDRRTQFEMYGDPVLFYQDEGKWEMSVWGKTTATEVCRDQTFIVLKDDEGDRSCVKIGLFGGDAYSSETENGPWEKLDGVGMTRRD